MGSSLGWFLGSFFTLPSTACICTLSLHDALPIFDFALSTWGPEMAPQNPPMLVTPRGTRGAPRFRAEYMGPRNGGARNRRSEEHTSELQSPDHLLCRLLLETQKVTHSGYSS